MTENQRRYQKAKEAYKNRARKWYHANKERHRKVTSEWRLKNQEKADAIRRKSRWKRNGIKGASEELYQHLLTEQSSLCAICADPAERFDLDHCHETGEIRGLLCRPCNIGLGHLERFRRLMILDKCKNYLQRHTV